MTWPPVALWAAIALTGVAVGAMASRWNAIGVPPALDRILLAGSAAAVIAWFANAGALLGNSASNALLAAFVPINAGPGFRLAVLWSTLPGAALSLGSAALIAAVLLPVGATERARFVGALAGIALVCLGIAAWFTPVVGQTAVTSVLPFLQSPYAAIAPLCALASLFGLAVAAASVVARRTLSDGWILLAWAASTAALATEQVARTDLGVGPRDGVVLGSASAGLILWLATSALMHRRVRHVLGDDAPTARDRRPPVLAHAGALLLALSFGAHAVASRSTVSITPGQTVSVVDAFGRDWRLANQGVSRYDADGADILSATIEARRPGGTTVILAPEIRDYHRADGSHLENSVSLRQSTGRGLTAMRLLLVEADSLDVTRLRVTFLPLPLLWHVGLALILVSVMMIATNLSRPRSALSSE